jgi:hypothetical protein
MSGRECGSSSVAEKRPQRQWFSAIPLLSVAGLQGLRGAQDAQAWSHVVIPRRKKIWSTGPVANAGQNGRSAAFSEPVAVELARWPDKRQLERDEKWAQ